MESTFTKTIEKDIDGLMGGAFLTAGNDKEFNTMTISWGSIGFMWRKPVFMVLVRESRYTNEFMKNGESFTVGIPYEKNKSEALKICGTKSGRDIEKEKEAGIKFIKSKKVKTPIIEGCEKYYECKIVFKNTMNLDDLDKEFVKTFYDGETKGHVLYFGEIVEEY